MYYDRVDISEGIDSSIGKSSKECMICHYYLFNHRFKFQDSVCNVCHDLMIFYLHISDIAITSVKVLVSIVLFMILTNLKTLIY